MSLVSQGLKWSLKWALFLNGRSSGSRCLLRIPQEQRGRASMPVHITLHTDTLPKRATEEISQLRLKVAAIWQSFCLILQRFNETCVFCHEIHSKKQLLKEIPLFFCCQSACCPSGKHSLPPCVYVFSQWEFTPNNQHIFITGKLHYLCADVPAVNLKIWLCSARNIYKSGIFFLCLLLKPDHLTVVSRDLTKYIAAGLVQILLSKEVVTQVTKTSCSGAFIVG